MRLASSQRRIPPIVRVAALACVAAGLVGCATPPAMDAQATAQRYRGVIDSSIRTDADRRMDASRKPADFLPFTQVQQGMQVLDVAAGGGYTAQLLVLAVAPGGRLWAQAPTPGAALKQRLAEHPQGNFIIVARPFDDPVPTDKFALRFVKPR